MTLPSPSHPPYPPRECVGGVSSSRLGQERLLTESLESELALYVHSNTRRRFSAANLSTALKKLEAWKLGSLGAESGGAGGVDIR